MRPPVPGWWLIPGMLANAACSASPTRPDASPVPSVSARSISSAPIEPVDRLLEKHLRVYLSESTRAEKTVAVEYFRRSCDRGDLTGCAWLGMAELKGEGADLAPTEARKRGESICSRGSAVGCTLLAESLLLAPERNLPRARDLLEASCEKEDPRACVRLGRLHREGTLGKADLIAAVSLFDKGCQAGVIEGCAWLGRAYLNGEGNPADPPKGQAMVEGSCRRSDPTGCKLLIERASSPKAMRAGSPDLRRMAELACEARDGEGCTFLARLYAEGIGGDRDEEAAARYRKLGCQYEYAKACELIGERGKTPDAPHPD